MFDWFMKIFFSHRRFILVLRLLYFLQCLLLSVKLLKCFHVRYDFPHMARQPLDLTLAQIGNLEIPLMTFLIVISLFHVTNKGFNKQLYRLFKSKTPLFKGLRQGVTTIAASCGWFRWINGSYRKGQYYGTFVSIMEVLEDSEIDLMAFATLFNSVLLSCWLGLLAYPQGSGIQLFLFIGLGAFYVTHVFNLFFLWDVRSNLPFFQNIQRKIDQQETSHGLGRPTPRIVGIGD